MSLHLVKDMTGDDLFQITEKLIKLVLQCGFHIVVIASDNNTINRARFTKLYPLWFPDDYALCLKHENYLYSTFLTYDSVHVAKNVRND